MFQNAIIHCMLKTLLFINYCMDYHRTHWYRTEYRSGENPLNLCAPYVFSLLLFFYILNICSHRIINRDTKKLTYINKGLQFAVITIWM